jgi:hypothetical protein
MNGRQFISQKLKQSWLYRIRKLQESVWYQKILFWQMTKFASPTSWLALTYDNEKHTDGAGAQLQRIYGIYALSRLLKMPYIHTPLTYLDYQGVAALETNSFNQEILSKYNQVFSLASDLSLPAQFSEYHCQNKVSLTVLAQLKQKAEQNQTFIVARIRYPYAITDNYPECYEVLKEISPFPFPESSVIRIAVHVRRGDLLFIKSYNKRILPNQYYLQIMQQLVEIMNKLNLKYEFELYTELPTKTFTITPEQQGISKQISESIVVDPTASKIEEFDVIPHLKKFINTDPIESMERMASAHIVVISHSSFSYLPSLLNQKGIIIYHQFWHSPLKQWIVADDNGNFSQAKLSKILKNNFNLQQFTCI